MADQRRVRNISDVTLPVGFENVSFKGWDLANLQ
jgi:hypothetical protein